MIEGRWAAWRARLSLAPPAGAAIVHAIARRGDFGVGLEYKVFSGGAALQWAGV